MKKHTLIITAILSYAIYSFLIAGEKDKSSQKPTDKGNENSSSLSYNDNMMVLANTAEFLDFKREL